MDLLTSLRWKVRAEYARIADVEDTLWVRRAQIAVSRAAATSALRSLDPSDPRSWEFCGFSQSREDGIIDFLCRQVKKPNRYFIEIGASNGQENNSTWLAIAERFSGIMVEGDQERADQCRRHLIEFTLGVEVLNLFVEPENAGELCAAAIHRDPDFFSIDIDGNDYFVLKALLEAGLRPKIIAAEYNSAFGPEQAATITYRRGFNYLAAHASGLYYGVSVAGLRALLGKHGYAFVATESNGVNAFFIDPGAFDPAFVDKLRGAPFNENFYQRTKYKTTWEAQFALIKHLPFDNIS
jgi:hypothetical protein